MTRQNILPMVADRFLNTPLLIDPAKAATIYGVLQGRIAADIPLDLGETEAEAVEIETEADGPKPGATRFKGTHRTTEGGYSYLRRDKGVALIHITGSLVNRGAWVGASSGLTSYEGIAAQIDKARTDDELHAAILDINSPGGEATGMFTVAQKVRELAAVKPVIAVVNDVAASAAYGIASGANEIVISPTSFVGSIGVVMVHIDHSGEMEQKGLKATIIHAGANKVDGHPFGPLSKDVRANLQSKVNILYDRFLETVEAGRGDRLDASSARKTEANIFIGQQAVELGIADRIGTFDQVLAELQNAPSGSKTENVTMADKTNSPKTEGANITQAALDQAVADAKAAGAQEATARISAIMTCEEAQGRAALANHFAFKTTMSVDDAKASLAVAPKEAGAQGGTSIPTPEQRVGNEPEMGAEEPQGQSASVDHGWGDVTAELNQRFA